MVDDIGAPSDEQVLASAAQFLIEGGEEDAASVILACSLALETIGGGFSGNEYVHSVRVNLRGPRSAFDMLNNREHPVTKAILEAVQAVLPDTVYVEYVSAHAALVTLDPDWQRELLQIARGKGIHNQVADVTTTRVRVWNGLRFRSESEVRIAQALDRASVLFLPNCKARVTDDTGVRLNREPDFLVCIDGKWGIIEVDGELFHPPSRTVHDHERDGLFKQQGVSVVEHFDATDCFNRPDDVVRTFLALLKRQG